MFFRSGPVASCSVIRCAGLNSVRLAGRPLSREGGLKSQRGVIVIEGYSGRFGDEEAETGFVDDETDGFQDHKHHAKFAGRKIA